MGRGRRYSDEKRLNIKKVFAVIIAILVIVMFFIVISKLLTTNGKAGEKSFILAYYSIYKDGKWGVIDTRGKQIIAPTYDEMIVIPDNSKPVFICTYNVNYENETYSSKVLNEKNKEIYTNYSNVEAIYNKDENNNLWYESALKVQKDGKYGLINLDGKQILNCEYDNIYALEGTKGVYITIKNDAKGLVDFTGKVVIENKYKDIKALTTKYENGFIVKNSDNICGVINYDSSIALQEKYEEIKNVYGNSMYVVKENGVWKIVDTEEKVYLENKFEDVKSINSDNIIIKVNGKYGVTTIEEETKIQVTYDDLTYAYSDMYIGKKDGKYGMVNLAGEEKVEFKYTYIRYLQEADFIQAENEDYTTDLLDRNLNIKVSGILSEINESKNYIRMRENDEYKYYNFKLEEKPNTEILSTNTIFLNKKDGKYGYINNKGIVVVDYIYDDATEQNRYGYVSVKKDGKWGSLNQKGEVVAQTIYELENNLVIDFIEDWHLAEDINANYYTK